MTIPYNLTGKQRKQLAEDISVALHTIPKYLGYPTCNYQIGDCILEKDGKLIIPEFEKYETEVLSLVASEKNRQIRATLKWLIGVGAMSESDEKKFKEFTDIRNKLVHDMTNTLLARLSEDVVIKYAEMLSLYEKVIKWWICNIEIPNSPDIAPEDLENIDYDNVSSAILDALKIMSDVAINSSKRYMEIMEEINAKPKQE